MARVFSLKNTPLNMWVIWIYIYIYIVWIKRGCIRYDQIEKQNVLWVSRGKALPVKYSRKPAVTICYDSSHSIHVLSTWLHFVGSLLTRYPRKLLSSSICLESLHSLSHITHTMKSHIKCRVHKIEQN